MTIILSGVSLMKCNQSFSRKGCGQFAGMVLHLIPWRENFQLAFERLDLAAVWIQLHHLAFEFWEANTLETIASQFGHLSPVSDCWLMPMIW